MPRFSGVDYFQIDSLFSEQEQLVRQTARQFVDDRIIPVVRDCFREGRFPRELIPEMAQLGFFGANLEGYGCAGMNNVEYGLVMQELERGDSGIRSFVSVQGRAGDVPDPHLRFRRAKRSVAAATAGWRSSGMLRPHGTGFRLQSRPECEPALSARRRGAGS